jgi:hypothetical protein
VVDFPVSCGVILYLKKNILYIRHNYMASVRCPHPPSLFESWPKWLLVSYLVPFQQQHIYWLHTAHASEEILLKIWTQQQYSWLILSLPFVWKLFHSRRIKSWLEILFSLTSRQCPCPFDRPGPATLSHAIALRSTDRDMHIEAIATIGLCSVPCIYTYN